MEYLKKLFDKNTNHGRAMRSVLQGIVALVTFMIGFLAIPGIGEYLATNEIMTFATFGMWLGVITYIHNTLETLLKWLGNE